MTLASSSVPRTMPMPVSSQLVSMPSTRGTRSALMPLPLPLAGPLPGTLLGPFPFQGVGQPISRSCASETPTLASLVYCCRTESWRWDAGLLEMGGVPREQGPHHHGVDALGLVVGGAHPDALEPAAGIERLGARVVGAHLEEDL